MAKYTSPVCRYCRREGVKLYLKGARCFSPKCPIERRAGQVPGQHGKKFTRNASDYGKQLREKQKVKRLYGLLEKQFRGTFEEAARFPGNTGLRMLQLLETRLDNVVYRMGLAPSRSVARQLVAHGNVHVDGKRLDVPSYRVKPNQVITLTTTATEIPVVKQALEAKLESVAWTKRDKAAGQVVRMPERSEISEDINEQLIIEFYSR